SSYPIFFGAFCSREPESTSLENALVVDPASGTGASSDARPHPTRPAVPPGGSPFFRRSHGPCTRLEHDPEKWEPVFRKDHAQTKRCDHHPIQLNRIMI